MLRSGRRPHRPQRTSVGLFVSGEMFGISVLFGLPTISSTGDSYRGPSGTWRGSRTIQPVTPRYEIDRAGCAPLPGDPSSPRAAPRTGARAGVRAARHRAPGLPPVRPARRDRAQSRPRPGGPHRGLPASLDGRPAVRVADPVRDLQQGPLDRADAGAALVSRRLGPEPGRAHRRRLRRARAAGRGAARPDPRDGPLSSTDVAPRAAIDWYWRPTNQVRAILEALAEAGILGLARREGNRRVYDLAERLFPAELLAEVRHPERDQRRHKLLSRYRAHGLLGRSGSAELWIGTRQVDPPGRRSECRRPAASCSPSSSSPERSCRSPSRGSAGDRFVLAEELALLESGRGGRGRRRRRDAGRRASPSSPRSIRSSGTATSCARCTASTTSGRSTSRPRNGAGATTSCRSSSATGSSGGSSRASTGGRDAPGHRLLVGGRLRPDGGRRVRSGSRRGAGGARAVRRT